MLRVLAVVHVDELVGGQVERDRIDRTAEVLSYGVADLVEPAIRFEVEQWVLI